jgi:exopolyphosphatase/guanosine-5'-triphosphate,3'-diphosphate pyrophosphatase
VRVHEGGIRDGLLLSMAREGISPGAEGTAGGQAIDPMKGVRRFAKACGYEAAHARHVTGLALEIFDQLAEQMGSRGGAGEVPDGQAWPARLDFGAEARLLLEAASLLHDVGYLINYAQHHKHSFHLITHADLPGFTTRQVRVIANVARYHRAAEPKLKHRTFAALGEGDRALVRQLAGVLRVADGLDRTHMQSVAGVRVKVGKGVAAFEVRAEREPSVDMWGAVRKAGLFKDVFGVLPEFEWRAAGPSKVEVAGRPRGETVTA